MKKVFVTGASGMLGIHLSHLLLEEGYQLRALVRDPSRYQGPLHEKLEIIQADLFDEYTEQLEGMDIVVHLAAETRVNVIKYEDYRHVNYHGTIHLFEMCKRAGVKKFVFVSTANTMGYRDGQSIGNEELPMQSPYTESFYPRSKKEAEDYLLKQSSSEVQVTILNPTFMIGDYDVKPSSGRIILLSYGKKLILCPPGGKNFVATADVARAIKQSFVLGKHGERYVIANENLGYKEFFAKVNGDSDKIRFITVSSLLIRMAGYVGDVMRRLGITTSLCSYNMKKLLIDNYYTNQKAKKALNIDYTPIDDAIIEAIDYFKQIGKLE